MGHEERQDTISTETVRGHLGKKDKFQEEDKGARVLEPDSSLKIETASSHIFRLYARPCPPPPKKRARLQIKRNINGLLKV